jgi:hypothetical protein
MALRSSLLGSCLLVACAVAPLAHAGPAEDKAAAQSLFDTAKKLLAAGSYAEACPKLEESERLDPAIGTLFKLADCYEHIGRTASAWTMFLDVQAKAHAANQADREKVAKERATALEPKLTRLVVNVTGADRARDIEVKRDGAVINKPVWGVPMPVDPGQHRVSASSPGKRPFESAIDARGEGKTVTVTVPDLEAPRAVDTPPVPTVVAPPTTTSTPTATPAPTATGSKPPPVRIDNTDVSRGMSSQRVAGLVIGGVGIAGIAVGTVFGLKAKSGNDEALKPENCRTSLLCTQHGLDLTDSARSAALGSSIAFVAGGAALVGGIVLFITAAKEQPKVNAANAVKVSPSIAPGFAGLVSSGRF